MMSAPSMAGITSANCANVSRRRSTNVRGESWENVCTPEIYETGGLASVPCPALAIEQHASMTGRADQPFPPSRVAEPERAAADVPWRKNHLAARAVRFFPAPGGLPDRPLFVCRVLPRVGQPLPLSSKARTSSGIGTAWRVV